MINIIRQPCDCMVNLYTATEPEDAQCTECTEVFVTRKSDGDQIKIS